MSAPAPPDRPLSDALADARAALDLPALPTATPGGLVAWALAPDLDAAPVPPDHMRRRSRGNVLGYPVRLLDPAPLAADLAARGLTFRRGPGLGYAIGGEPVEPSQAARLLADVLDDAASALPDAPLGHVFDTLAALEETEYEILCRTCDTHDDDATLPEALAAADWTRPHRAALDATVRSRVPFADHAAHREASAVLGAIRRALRHTATDVRASQAAERAALALVRPLLPSGGPARSATDAAAFLATFDAEPIVERPSLGRQYEAAGRPGALSGAALYALASDRWGAVRTVKGVRLWRPAPATAALRLTR